MSARAKQDAANGRAWLCVEGPDGDTRASRLRANDENRHPTMRDAPYSPVPKNRATSSTSRVRGIGGSESRKTRP